jgi:RNA polymerase sigma-70 factor (ECF subfamily)
MRRNAPGGEFIRLFLPLQGDLLAYLMALGLSPEDAADALQEAAVDMLARFDSFQPGTSFRAWAFTFARNEALTMLKSRARRLALTAEAAAELERISLRGADAPTAAASALASCIQRLQKAARSLLDMRYRQGLGVREMARSLRRPVDSVYTSLFRIRRTLRGCVEQNRGLQEAGP